jgi:hypothetical protein
MHIRRISNAVFRRNRPFWLRRRLLGEEIRLVRMRRVIGILYSLRPLRLPHLP